MKKFPHHGKMDKMLALIAMLALACFMGTGAVLAWEFVSLVVALEARWAKALALFPFGFFVLLGYVLIEKAMIEKEEEE